MSGMVAGVPYQGGATWAALQYVLGFKRLGHDVYFLEPLTPRTLCPPDAPLAQTANASYFNDVMRAFGLEQNSALLLTSTRETVGLPYGHLRQIAGRADVVANLSGTLKDAELLDSIPIRVFLDLDPGFNQLWHEVGGIDMGFAAHTHFVTVGLSLGRPECDVPTCGRHWFPTLQPIVLSYWPVAHAITYDALTSIGNWRAYGSIEHQGIFYGQKAHSLRRLLTLPKISRESFCLALSIHPDERSDLQALKRNGWNLLDPAKVAATPDLYQEFIRGSKAELGVAKSGYVVSRAGWFSDRSVCYLASGRPVIAQETGFSRFLPTGKGLLGFQTAEEAVGAIEAINKDYRQHASASRAIAEDHFDSDKVLSGLLCHLGVAA